MAQWWCKITFNCTIYGR